MVGRQATLIGLRILGFIELLIAHKATILAVSAIVGGPALAAKQLAGMVKSVCDAVVAVTKCRDTLAGRVG
nr:hypothetical protein [Sphingomonas sp. CDS-1]